MHPILVLGAGGTALDVLEIVAALGLPCLGLLDDDPAKAGTAVLGSPILGPFARAADYPTAELVDATGSPRSYQHRPARLCALAPRCRTLIHPRATVASSATVGPGCLILAGAVVGPLARLGAHVQVLPTAVVSHEATVGDWSILATGAILSGRVTVGRCAYLGAGATVIQDGMVGDGALVGMGAVVIRPVPPGATVVGNPAHHSPAGISRTS